MLSVKWNLYCKMYFILAARMLFYFSKSNSMQCIGYGPVPCPPLFLLWCLVNVDRECSITLTYLCPDSCFDKSSPLPHAPAFHSPCSSALAFCCEVVYVHSDSSVVLSIPKFPFCKHCVTPQRMLWNWLWPLHVSRVCPTTCGMCLVTQSDLRTFGCPPQVGTFPLLLWALRVHVNGKW